MLKEQEVEAPRERACEPPVLLGIDYFARVLFQAVLCTAGSDDRSPVLILKKGRQLIKEQPTMTEIFLQSIALLASNPVSLTHLGLATVHMIAARYYLTHAGGRPLAWCNGVASVFYVLLAYLYSLPH